MSAVPVLSAGGGGACLGFVLADWQGAAVAGAVGWSAGVGLLLRHWFLQRRRESALRAAGAGGHAGGTADAVLFDIRL
ncbi:hypothetical protein OIE71_34345 [Streptomyces sp. NBC_01725]|uniref:hypothetical protein n=1 Tax=Streptomyces sp. NBC_01725 TaxID=2975923 RepID=UPI002E285A42|nr:hypothetical protein [Streptomyces sp. NBC_01725]